MNKSYNMSRKHTILYVDDEPINLELFRLNLKKFYNIYIAERPKDGLELLKKHDDIEVVISDMRMPEMDGLTFIKEAKKDYPNIYYYILTGYDIDEDISQALKEDLIQQYFMKPFDIESIIVSVNGVYE